MRVYVPATIDDLRQWHAAGAVPTTDDAFEPPDDSEDGEYAALMAAAEASASLADGGRRVVVVAEASGDGAVPFRDVAAVHADTTEGARPDDELAWFATQEIPDLVG